MAVFGGWAFLIAALFFQESTSTNTALLLAWRAHFNMWIVNAIWLGATSFAVWGGFAIGSWTKRSLADTRFGALARRGATELARLIGERGERVAFIFLGIINFPWLNAFLAAWLGVRLADVFLSILIGSAFWYALVWTVNLGIRSFVPNFWFAIYTVIGVGLLLALIGRIILRKALKANE